MKTITMKEFCNYLGFRPNNKGKNLGDLADMIGVSISYISKLYNARYIGTSGPTWDKICAFVEAHGFQLTTANPEDFLCNNITKKNNKLEEENKLLKLENELLKEELEELKELVRVSKRIAEYEVDRRTIICRK